ncbi:MAG TPA: HAD-IA family hydrolase [Patescibacteria group bacterium]
MPDSTHTNTKIVIFDFDGTIADSLDILVKIINKQAHRYGYKKITETTINRFRDENSLTILRDMKLPLLRILFLARHVKKEFQQSIEEVKPVYGMHKTLRTLKDQGYTLGIATSNSKVTVEQFLKQHDLDIFDFVIGKTVFNKGKMLAGILRHFRFPLANVFYVGDETRDIEAARHANIKVISVTWGINSGELLSTYNPDFIIDKPEQLTEVVKG